MFTTTIITGIDIISPDWNIVYHSQKMHAALDFCFACIIASLIPTITLQSKSIFLKTSKPIHWSPVYHIEYWRAFGRSLLSVSTWRGKKKRDGSIFRILLTQSSLCLKIQSINSQQAIISQNNNFRFSKLWYWGEEYYLWSFLIKYSTTLWKKVQQEPTNPKLIFFIQYGH